MNGRARAFLAAAAAAAALAGCATDSQPGPADTPPEQAQAGRTGVVESVRPVTIEGAPTGVGATVGSVAGGIGGSMIGSGRGSAVAAIAGAVAGGLLGRAVEEQSRSNRPGVEITVRLDNGELRAVVQPAGETFKPGDRVRLVTVNGEPRVSR
jgi:outer membrane lipoprotein SlyB